MRSSRLTRYAKWALAVLVGALLAGFSLAAPGAPAPAEAAGIAAVSAGQSHTCALTTGGGVKCWGENTNGQLGNGTTTDSLTPVDVSGLSSGVAAISSGLFHTCALTTDGGVKCWGTNHYGHLGATSAETCDSLACSTTPLDVTGLTSGVAAVSTGWGHTCALTTGGGVKCWGYNGEGQLGTTSAETCNSFDCSTTPLDVDGLTSGAAAVSVLDFHTCALTTGGGVKCWGENLYGSLGNGTTTDSATPVDVCAAAGCASTLSGIAALGSGGSGGQTCVLTTGGGAKCWGQNWWGALGATSADTCDATPCSLTPLDVSGLTSGVAAISGGGLHTCAVTTSGGVKCFGYNSTGQLGTDNKTNSSTPVDVCAAAGCASTLSSVESVSTGQAHTCAVTTGGGVKCWGWNDKGQLGDGTFNNQRNTPVDVDSAVKVPPNDDFADAIVVGSLPFSHKSDTSGATVAGNDPVLQPCGTGADSNTVWYQYTPATDELVNITTAGSDYDTVVTVYTGTKGALTPVFCNDDKLLGGFNVQASKNLLLTGGTQYYIMVGAYGAGPGGNLIFSMGPANGPYYACYFAPGLNANTLIANVTNQFASESVFVGDGLFYCPPTEKNKNGNPFLPALRCFAAFSDFTGGQTIDILDQYGVDEQEIGLLSLLCVPAGKDGGGVEPLPYYACYESPGTAATDPDPFISNQFSFDFLSVSDDRALLCVSSLKLGVGELELPPLVCYFSSGGQVGGSIDLETQFGLDGAVPVFDPFFFCTQALKLGNNDGNLGGVYDILVGDLNSGSGGNHCITKVSHQNVTNLLETYTQCYATGLTTTNTPPTWEDTCDTLAARIPPECVPGQLSNSSEAPPGELAGPPPPPYPIEAPAVGRGFYYPGGAGSPGGVCGITDCTVTTTCFEDTGATKLAGANTITVTVILNPKVGGTVQADTDGDTVKDTQVDRVSQGTVTVLPNQSNARCAALTPKGIGFPFAAQSIHVNDKGGTNINPNPAPWRPGSKPGATVIDFDGDGCTDEQELDPKSTAKCGDDPQNPSDSFSDPNAVDLSGVYDFRLRIARGDCTDDQCTDDLPGSYLYCRTDLQHEQPSNDLEARTYCYNDSVLSVINPEAYPGITGDGMAGAYPPGPQDGNGGYVYGDVDETHAILTGTFNKITNEIELSGCFLNPDDQGTLGISYIELTASAHQLPGGVADIWTNQPAGCAGSPDGAVAFSGEVSLVQPNPNKGKGYDQDNDGVPTERELGDDAACGRRDPYNKNDYYDVSIPRDGVIDLANDILGTIVRFAPGGYAPGNENWDRPQAMIGRGAGSTWNRGSPDGVIDLANDILGVILQFNPGGCPANS